MSEQWMVKGCDVQELEAELNGLAIRGYTIRWLIREDEQDWPDFTIVAERRVP